MEMRLTRHEAVRYLGMPAEEILWHIKLDRLEATFVGETAYFDQNDLGIFHYQLMDNGFHKTPGESKQSLSNEGLVTTIEMASVLSIIMLDLIADSDAWTAFLSTRKCWDEGSEKRVRQIISTHKVSRGA